MKLSLLLLLSAFLGFSCAVKEHRKLAYIPEGPLKNLYNSDLFPFYHNVASGDPLEDAVIIWTKVLPSDSSGQTVRWEVAEDKAFDKLVRSGKTVATAENNFTVKIDVDGLEPGTTYFYRFNSDEIYSPVGRTRTLPTGNVDQLKFAVVSCSHWEAGYFNAYRHIAEREDVDAVLHLGDYIYEYGDRTGGNSEIGRTHVPAHEIITLDDYRTRYAQYRLDPDLQQIHQMHPFIVIWDDHEVANNSYKDGAQNHQPEEGDYEERKANARKAYYEWMPVRDQPVLYRSFQFGDLGQLIMLDERIAGRTKQASNSASFAELPEDHSMLGEQQLEWFLDELEENSETWQIIGNQVTFSYLNRSVDRVNLNPDAWDGYPQERDKIVNHLTGNNINNVIFLTGDTHSSWAYEVTTDPFTGYDSATAAGAVAVEFGVTSVSSTNLNERMPNDTVRLLEKNVLLAANPHLKYVNRRDHGYLLLTLKPENAKAEWFYTNTLKSRDSREHLDKTAVVNKNEHKLHLK